MMFLVIFSSLAAAMAIVAQGNLATADTHMKINRALSAAETGMRYLANRINLAARQVPTADGVIDADNAPDLWVSLRDKLMEDLAAHSHFLDGPYQVITNADGSTSLLIGAVAVGPVAPDASDADGIAYFRARLTPLPSDPTIVRVLVTGYDGPAGKEIKRSIQMDFRLDKKIRFALLSKSRVMLGRNVMVEGPIGSRFTETELLNGHPVQMESDFRGLSTDLDAALDAFVATLIENDTNHDNRINTHSPTETDGITDPTSLDTNGDGYIDGFDFFMAEFDDGDGVLTAVEFGTTGDIQREQLFRLLDTAGDPSRPGYNDGQIDAYDQYAKVKGQVMLLATMQSWMEGAAADPHAYQDFFQGAIVPGFGQQALIAGPGQSDIDVHSYTPADFDVQTYRDLAVNDLLTEAATQAATHDPDNPNSPGPLGETTFEEVPFGAAHPYDYYDRPVYRNMTFRDVRIPKGANALFINCKFVGVTFIETETDNADDMFNYAGMQNADGSLKHPDQTATVGGAEVTDTKALANNLRFHNCTFEGSIVSDAPTQYTHARNKVSFTGQTQFDVNGSTALTADEKRLYTRSSILMPHYSVEMGTFVAPHDSNETVNLTGTIVAGILDIRGQADVRGTILTTFEPRSGEGPVIGETSPQFNTTLGYFPSSAGDLEAELPTTGFGVIHLRYDPTLPLPDGITGPIELRPNVATYEEVSSVVQ